jgi:hypothetical protein
MDRSRQLHHLEQAERHLLRGERNLSELEQRIEELESHGHDATLARAVLETSSAIRRASRSDPQRTGPRWNSNRSLIAMQQRELPRFELGTAEVPEATIPIGVATGSMFQRGLRTTISHANRVAVSGKTR